MKSQDIKAIKTRNEVIDRVKVWCKQLEERLITAAMEGKVVTYSDVAGACKVPSENGYASLRFNGTSRITFEIGPFHTEYTAGTSDVSSSDAQG